VEKVRKLGLEVALSAEVAERRNRHRRLAAQGCEVQDPAVPERAGHPARREVSGRGGHQALGAAQEDAPQW
jgi:hypothetical protein